MNSTDPIAVRLREIREAQDALRSAINIMSARMERNGCVIEEDIDHVRAKWAQLTKLVRGV